MGAPDEHDLADACDDLPFDARKLLHALKEEERTYRKHEKRSDNSRARSIGIRYENLLRDRYADQPDFFLWDQNRALDRQDFDYLFFHRAHFNPSIRTWLEIVASKITHVCDDGDEGYFNKLQQNVGWTKHITPIIFCQAELADALVRCGLWTSSKSSRRCHKTDLCALCKWLEHLKVLVEAFRPESGAFERAPAWWFLTLGFTTNPRNSKWQVKGFGEHGREEANEDRTYDPYPVALGPTEDDPTQLPSEGYDDARLLGLVIQEALDELYQSQVVDGFRHKLEGAFTLGLTNRMNMHGHCVANGRETNAEFVAEQLYAHMVKGLEKYRAGFSRDYFPDVKVCLIESPEHLEASFVYMEKVVSVDKIVAEALARPEAKLPDGRWDRSYLTRLESYLFQLLQWDIPHIFTRFKYDQETMCLHRRKTVGNMTFSDRDTCIGREPKWHVKVRRKNAKKTREARERQKEREAEARGKAQAKPEPKKQKRSRSNPRRFKRTMAKPQTGGRGTQGNAPMVKESVPDPAPAPGLATLSSEPSARPARGQTSAQPGVPNAVSETAHRRVMGSAGQSSTRRSGQGPLRAAEQTVNAVTAQTNQTVARPLVSSAIPEQQTGSHNRGR